MLTHTCELNGVNARDYLIELMRHSEDAEAASEAWLPWNYEERLAATARSSAPAASPTGAP